MAVEFKVTVQDTPGPLLASARFWERAESREKAALAFDAPGLSTTSARCS